MTTVLITGATGHLGARVAARAAEAGWTVAGTYLRAATPAAAEQLDIRDQEAVRALVGRVRPES